MILPRPTASARAVWWCALALYLTVARGAEPATPPAHGADIVRTILADADLRDVALVDELSVNAAARRTHYSTSGNVTTIKGTGFAGSQDDGSFSAEFNLPTGIAIDSHHNLYVADTGNHTIRKLTSSLGGGYTMTTLAGKAGFTGLVNSTGAGARFNKPQGITILYEDELQARIWPLPCRKINGIGPKADAKLQAHGIHTIGELAAKDEQWLIDHFGQSTGAWMFRAAWGRDERAVVTESEPVSMSRETTFERDLHAVRDKAELGVIFTRLCEQVAADLQRKGYAGKTVGIKLRFDNFKSVTRNHTLDHFISDARAIRQAAGQCLKRVPLDRRIRLLGVRVGNLMKNEAVAPAPSGPVAIENIASTGQLF